MREYASTLSDFLSIPLPWDRTYVVLTPSSAEAARLREAFPDEARDALARDAVLADARGARGPFWWAGAQPCDLERPERRQPQIPPSRQVAYPRSDPHARALAERLVALAGSRPGTPSAGVASSVPAAMGADAPLRAAGLDEEELAAALRAGGDFAYVLALPSRVAAPCAEADALLRSAPWLDAQDELRPAAGPTREPEALPRADDFIIPLVEVRPWLIARRGLAGIGLDWDGTPDLRDLGWKPAGGRP